MDLYFPLGQAYQDYHLFQIFLEHQYQEGQDGLSGLVHQGSLGYHLYLNYLAFQVRLEIQLHRVPQLKIFQVDQRDPLVPLDLGHLVNLECHDLSHLSYLAFL